MQPEEASESFRNRRRNMEHQSPRHSRNSAFKPTLRRRGHPGFLVFRKYSRESESGDGQNSHNALLYQAIGAIVDIIRYNQITARKFSSEFEEGADSRLFHIP